MLAAVADVGPVRVDEIAERVGLPVSSVYRYVRSLLSLAFLERQDGFYVLGARLTRLGCSRPANRLRDVALPVLRSVADDLGETVLLTTRNGLSALVVETIESSQPMRLSYASGTLHPLHAGASGKVLLAFAPTDIFDEVVSRGLERFTPHTPNRARLAKSMDEIRKHRLAVTRSERDLHAIGIGVPVELDGQVVCAISVAGPEHRLENRVAHAVRVLKCGAADLRSVLTDNEPHERAHRPGTEEIQSP